MLLVGWSAACWCHATTRSGNAWDPSGWLHWSVGIWLIILLWSTSDKSITSTTPHNCSKSFHSYAPSTTTCSSTHSWCDWWWTARGHCDLQRSNRKKRQITPTPVEPSTSTSPSTPKPSSDPASYSVVHVPEMTIPDEWYPEHINLRNASKEYWCQGCSYTHSNLDTILTHVRKEHLKITFGWPTCGKPYQNAASLCKHGKEIHKIIISS